MHDTVGVDAEQVAVEREVMDRAEGEAVDDGRDALRREPGKSGSASASDAVVARASVPNLSPSAIPAPRPAREGADLQGLRRVSDGTRTRGRRDHNSNTVVARVLDSADLQAFRVCEISTVSLRLMPRLMPRTRRWATDGRPVKLRAGALRSRPRSGRRSHRCSGRPCAAPPCSRATGSGPRLPPA